MKKVWVFLYISLMLVLTSTAVFGATYSGKSYNGLTITSNSSLTGGNYNITGDFVVNSGVEVTIKATTNINATGDIIINGKIKTDPTELTLRLISTGGDITINNQILIYSKQGNTGSSGSPTQNGHKGYNGNSSHLYIKATTGDVIIKGLLTNTGGTGGTGGAGGRSDGWSDGGRGGEGGKGGNGGNIGIFSYKGQIKIYKSIKSLGGTGGKGGKGGNDNSIVGGPGAGGDGGQGGDGGLMAIVGQDIRFYSGSGFTASRGSGGAGGAGGNAGDIGGSGRSGDTGRVGQSQGKVQLAGGKLYYGTSLAQNAPGLGSVQFSSVSICFVRDNEAPYKPGDVKFPYYYNAQADIYYTNVTNPEIMIKAPQDAGVDYSPTTPGVTVFFSEYADSGELCSGIKQLTFEGNNYLQNIAYDSSRVSGGYYRIPLNINRVNTLTSLVLSMEDYYGNKGTWSSADYPNQLNIYIDTIKPGLPEITGLTLTGTNLTDIQINWATLSDVSGIANYDLYVNGTRVESQLAERNYLYHSTYNQKLDITVLARDRAGNLSSMPAQPMVTEYTASKGTTITGVTPGGTKNNGYYADVKFKSVGNKAKKYKITYYKVGTDGQKIGSDQYSIVENISTTEGQNYTHRIGGLEAHGRYHFEISTGNSDPLTLYTDSIDYSPQVVIPNNPPTVPGLLTPVDGDYINAVEAEDFELAASPGTDADGDLLTYTFYIDGRGYSPDTIESGKVSYRPAIVNTTFEWYVTVTDNRGGTAQSPTRTVTIDTIAPAQPSFGLQEEFVSDNQAKLINIAADGAVKLRIGPDRNGQEVEVDQTDHYTLIIPNVEGKYRITLKSIDLAGNVSSEYAQNICYDHTAPQNPTSLTLTGGINSLAVSWSSGLDPSPTAGVEVSGVAKYQLKYRKVDTDTWIETVPFSGANYTISTLNGLPLEDNSEYQVLIKTFDNAGNSSAYTTEIYKRYTKPSLGSLNNPEQNFEPDQAGGYLHFVDFVVNPGKCQDYRIYREDKAEPSEWIDSVETDYRDYVQPNHTYRYKIETRNQDGLTRASGWQTLVMENNQPSVPTGLTVSGFVNSLQPVLGCSPVIDPDGTDTITYYYKINRLNSEGEAETIIKWAAANDGINYQLTLELEDGYRYNYYVGVDDGHTRVHDDEGDLVPIIISEPNIFTIDCTPPEVLITVPDDISEKVANGEFIISGTVKVFATDNPVISGGGSSGLKSLYYYWNDASNDRHYISSGDSITLISGVNTLKVVAEDYRNNLSQPETMLFKVDGDLPIISDLGIIGTKVNQTIYTANSSVLNLFFTVSDFDSGVKEAYYAVITDEDLTEPVDLPDTQWKSLALGTGVEQTFNFFESISLVNGETYYLVVKAIDNVGRESVGTSMPVTVDHGKPIVTFTDTNGMIPGKYLISSVGDLSLQVSVDDTISGVKTVEYGLSETMSESGVSDWHDRIAEISDGELTDGKEYYLVTRVTDHAGNLTVAYSVPIYFDSTAPVFRSLIGGERDPLTDQFTDQWNNSYLKVQWQIEDQSNLAAVRYKVGTVSGGNDISSNWPDNDNGWITVNDLANEKTLIIEELDLVTDDYYITVEATNDVGLSTIRTANAISIDTALTPCPTVEDDGIYTNMKDIHFTVRFPNEESKDYQYYYQVIDDAGNTVIAETLLSNTAKADTVSLTISESEDMSLANGSTYYLLLGQIVSGEFTRVSNSDGITLDVTNPVFSSLNDGEYFAKNNVTISWNADDTESSITQYYYKIGTSRYGDELTPDWISVGSMLSVVLPDPGFEHNTLYYISIKAVNGAGGETIAAGDGFTIDATPPPVPAILTGSNYINVTDRLSASWTWTEEEDCSEVLAYYYDILQEPDINLAVWKPVVSVTGDPQSTVLTVTDLALENNHTYYFAVKAVNAAGMESSQLSLGVTIDLDAPTIPEITDEGYSTRSNTSLTANFSSDDSGSGLSIFEYAVGDREVADSIKSWSSIGATEVTDTGLNLTNGEVYYFTAKAVDQANNRSYESISDGILVDSNSPVVSNLISEGEYSLKKDELFFTWECTPSFAAIDRYEYYLTDDPDYIPVDSDWKSHNRTQLLVKAIDEIGLPEFEDNATYYLYVRAVDKADKVSNVEHTGVNIDTTAPTKPVIESIGEYQSQNLKLKWSSSDTGSGIKGYEYGIGTIRGSVDVTEGWIPVDQAAELIEIQKNDLVLEHNQRYYLTVRAQNNAGQWSEPSSDNGFLVDLYPPTVTSVEGPAVIISTSDPSTVTFSALEEEVPIKAYRYGIILTEDKENITELTGAGILIPEDDGTYSKEVTRSFTIEREDVSDGTYCIGVQVQSILDEWSEIGYSAPLTVDKTLPTVNFVDVSTKIVTNEESLTVGFIPGEIGTVHYRVKKPDGSYIPEIGYFEQGIATTDIAQIDVQLTDYGRYELHIFMVDSLGNIGPELSKQIRHNAPPIIDVGAEKTIYKGRLLTITTSDLYVSDTGPDQDGDGYNLALTWDFGDGKPLETSNEVFITHTYDQVGVFDITLTAIDDDNGVTTAQLRVIVTNTLGGELELDETWSGTVRLLGGIVVPEDKVLTIEADSMIIVPQNEEIVIKGTIVCNGEDGQIKFTPLLEDGETGCANLWRGIYLDSTSVNSILDNVVIEFAERGLTLNRQTVAILNSNFVQNGIGIHLESSTVTIQNSIFNTNLYYGIKDEGNSLVEVNNTRFIDNGVAPYYDAEKTIMDLNEINAELGSGNLDQ